MNDAEKCKANGWGVGMYLVGDEGYGPDVIQITAVGEEKILAKKIVNGSGETVSARESLWTLECRDWKPCDLQRTCRCGSISFGPAGFPMTHAEAYAAPFVCNGCGAPFETSIWRPVAK